MPQKLSVEVRPYNPSRRALDALAVHVAAAARELVGGVEHRVVALHVHPPEEKSAGAARASRFRATVVDYANGRTLDLIGDIADPAGLRVEETARQPAVGNEEFAAAVAVLRTNGELGDRTAYRPMPPHVPLERPDGARDRAIAVGLAGKRHEIVAVDLGRRRVVRFEQNAPPRSLAAATLCGVPAAADQTTADQGTPGTARISVRRGGSVLWELVATRPAGSSGFWGSGVELRDVRFRGHRVLHQAHVPILNVRYDGDKCGPYRDWQWQEGMIRADGEDVAPGFRLCSTPAQTILESKSDRGDFLGVAVYVDGEDVVLVSELEAGWYRYVSSWRLRSNGEIRPRFGFAATSSSCVCNVHHHHAYWRLDFDIGGLRNVVNEFNDPAIGRGKWQTLAWETKRPRVQSRRWRIGDGAGHAYELVPGERDGSAAGDDYARGDLWFLRRRDGQLDDNPIAGTEAELDRFVGRESILNQDVVVWYGAHFTHDVRHAGPADEDHVVGPTVVPRGWNRWP